MFVVWFKEELKNNNNKLKLKLKINTNFLPNFQDVIPFPSFSLE